MFEDKVKLNIGHEIRSITCLSLSVRVGASTWALEMCKLKLNPVNVALFFTTQIMSAPFVSDT